MERLGEILGRALQNGTAFTKCQRSHNKMVRFRNETRGFSQDIGTEGGKVSVEDALEGLSEEERELILAAQRRLIEKRRSLGLSPEGKKRSQVPTWERASKGKGYSYHSPPPRYRQVLEVLVGLAQAKRDYILRVDPQWLMQSLEVYHHVSVSRTTAWRHLVWLEEQGFIKRYIRRVRNPNGSWRTLPTKIILLKRTYQLFRGLTKLLGNLFVAGWKLRKAFEGAIEKKIERDYSRTWASTWRTEAKRAGPLSALEILPA